MKEVFLKNSTLWRGRSLILNWNFLVAPRIFPVFCLQGKIDTSYIISWELQYTSVHVGMYIISMFNENYFRTTNCSRHSERRVIKRDFRGTNES